MGKKTTEAPAVQGITARSMKRKEKVVLVPSTTTITKTPKGGYMAKGQCDQGTSCCALMSEANALDAIKKGYAKKGWD